MSKPQTLILEQTLNPYPLTRFSAVVNQVESLSSVPDKFRPAQAPSLP